jgi:hypothetical protein
MLTIKKGRYDRYLIAVDNFPVAWSTSLPAARRQAQTLAEGGLRSVPGLLPIDFARLVVTDTWNQGETVAEFRVGAER